MVYSAAAWKRAGSAGKRQSTRVPDPGAEWIDTVAAMQLDKALDV